MVPTCNPLQPTLARIFVWWVCQWPTEQNFIIYLHRIIIVQLINHTENFSHAKFNAFNHFFAVASLWVRLCITWLYTSHLNSITIVSSLIFQTKLLSNKKMVHFSCTCFRIVDKFHLVHTKDEGVKNDKILFRAKVCSWKIEWTQRRIQHRSKGHIPYLL